MHCTKKKLDCIKAMLIIANAQRKRKKTGIEMKYDIIFVLNVMHITQQVNHDKRKRK